MPKTELLETREIKMYTDEQKSRIKNSVYALPAKKRDKIIKLVSLLSKEQDDDIQFDIMLSYLDDDMNKELDNALKQIQKSGYDFGDMDVQELKNSVPKKVKMNKKK